MIVALVGIGGLVALSSREHNHIALYGFGLGLDGHTTARRHHLAIALGSTETGIQEHQCALGLHAVQSVV